MTATEQLLPMLKHHPKWQQQQVYYTTTEWLITTMAYWSICLCQKICKIKSSFQTQPGSVRLRCHFIKSHKNVSWHVSPVYFKSHRGSFIVSSGINGMIGPLWCTMLQHTTLQELYPYVISYCTAFKCHIFIYSLSFLVKCSATFI